jgi:hypothetical protein
VWAVLAAHDINGWAVLAAHGINGWAALAAYGINKPGHKIDPAGV